MASVITVLDEHISSEKGWPRLSFGICHFATIAWYYAWFVSITTKSGKSPKVSAVTKLAGFPHVILLLFYLPVSLFISCGVIINSMPAATPNAPIIRILVKGRNRQSPPVKKSTLEGIFIVDPR